MSEKSDINGSFNFYQAKNSGSEFLALLLIPLSALFALTFISIFANGSSVAPSLITLSATFLSIILVTAYKSRKAVEEEIQSVRFLRKLLVIMLKVAMELLLLRNFAYILS